MKLIIYLILLAVFAVFGRMEDLRFKIPGIFFSAYLIGLGVYTFFSI